MNSRFLRACQREPVDCTPVWFMRQAGRYMAEYRALRARYTMLELCRTPELAVQITLQPLRLGFDAAIVFSDITAAPRTDGCTLPFLQVRRSSCRPPPSETKLTSTASGSSTQKNPSATCWKPSACLRKELKVPLIGFAGAPFTLASYLIEGGKSANYARTKQLMLTEPSAWHALMGKLRRSGPDAICALRSTLAPKLYSSSIPGWAS